MTLCMSSVSIKMLQYEKIDASEEHVCNGCHGLLTMACSLIMDAKKLWVGLGVNYSRWLEMLVANLMINQFCLKLNKFYSIGAMN